MFVNSFVEGLMEARLHVLMRAGLQESIGPPEKFIPGCSHDTALKPLQRAEAVVVVEPKF